MPLTRPRRIVRRAVMVVVLVVLLSVWYVGSISCLVFVAAAGWMPDVVERNPVSGAYAVPLIWFVDSDLPGSDACRELIALSQRSGQRLRNQ